MNDITNSLKATLSIPTASMAGKSRDNFTHFHLNSANIFINSAFNLEQTYSKDDASEEVKLDHISYTSSAVIASVAALESNINEIFTDFINKYKVLLDKKPDENKTLRLLNEVVKIFSDNDLLKTIGNTRRPTLIKYKTMAALKEKSNSISQKSENILTYIIDIRNNLIHFSPEWDNELISYKKLEAVYKSQHKKAFSLNPFYDKQHTFFPRLCLSASCAKWCRDKVDSFIKKYSVAINARQI